jgi:hypothetical protein
MLDDFVASTTYEFPLMEGSVSRLFAALTKDASSHGILDWGISQTRYVRVYARLCVCLRICVCMYVCACVCMCLCICVCVCMYVGVSVSLFVCVFGCAHERGCVYVHRKGPSS